MTMKLAQGWQVMLADLSLILFLTTATALTPGEPAEPGATAETADIGEAVGVFRAGGEVELAEWLASRATDPREVLTVSARYAPGDREAVAQEAQALAAHAAATGLEPRVVIEPGPVSETLVLFSFAGGAAMARNLQRSDAGTASPPST